MAKIKIALIGAGSFVFGPSMLSQVILENRLDDVEMALVDLDTEVLELLAGVGRRMARERDLSVTLTTHTGRDAALDGADYVVNTAAVQMQRRFMQDVEIIEQHIPGHLVTEFGGVAGISYSLRQIAFIEGLAADMRRLCPQARLLDIANPLPRVCQAAHEAGIQTIGFCSVAILAYDMVQRIMGGTPGRYPFSEARARYELVSGGTNHFAWVVHLRDRESGADLLPELRERVRNGATSGSPNSEKLLRETGYLLIPADDHTQDFLVPGAGSHSRQVAWHGNLAERQQRLTDLKDVAESRQSWDVLLEHVSWERPADFIGGLSRGQEAVFGSLNLVNTGQIPQLPQGIFVETPCTVNADGIVPQPVNLPPAVLPHAQRTALVTNAIVRAAHERSRAGVHEAVQLDPTILDKEAGIRAVDACLAAHADLLPMYT